MLVTSGATASCVGSTPADRGVLGREMETVLEATMAVHTEDAAIMATRVLMFAGRIIVAGDQKRTSAFPRKSVAQVPPPPHVYPHDHYQ